MKQNQSGVQSRHVHRAAVLTVATRLLILTVAMLCGAQAPAKTPLDDFDPKEPDSGVAEDTRTLKPKMMIFDWKAYGATLAKDPAVKKMSPLERAKYITDKIGQEYDKAGIKPNNSYFGKGRQGFGGESPGTCGDLTVNISDALEGAGFQTGSMEVEKTSYNPFNVNRNHGAPIVVIDGKEYVFDLWYHSGAEGKFSGFKDSPFAMPKEDWETQMKEEGYTSSTYAPPPPPPGRPKKKVNQDPKVQKLIELGATPEEAKAAVDGNHKDVTDLTKRLHKEKAQKEKEAKAEQEKIEKAKAELEKAEKEKAAKAEQEKIEKAKAEQEKIEKAKAEQEKKEQIQKESEAARERLKEKIRVSKLDKEQAEQEKIEKAKAEKEKLEKAEKEKIEKAEKEKAAKAEQEKKEQIQKESEAARERLREKIRVSKLDKEQAEDETKPDNDLRDAEPKSDAEVDVDTASNGANTSSSYGDRLTEEQEQRSADGSSTMAQNTQMDEASNVGNQQTRDAKTTRDSGGRDAQITADAAARNTAKSDRENSWGKAIGDGVEAGITEGATAMGSAFGSGAADVAIGAIFGPSKEDEDSSGDGNGKSVAQGGASGATSGGGSTKGKKPGGGGASGGSSASGGGSGGGGSGGEDGDILVSTSDDIPVDGADIGDPLGVTGTADNDDGTVTIRYRCGYSWTGPPPGPSRCPVCALEEEWRSNESSSSSDSSESSGDTPTGETGGDSDGDKPPKPKPPTPKPKPKPNGGGTTTVTTGGSC